MKTTVYTYIVNFILAMIYYISTNVIKLRLWYVKGRHSVKLIDEKQYSIGENEFTIYKYVTDTDGKTIYVNTIKLGLTAPETITLDTTTLHKIRDNRNMIVYCLLRTVDAEIDITEEFRKFAYYYSGEYEECKLKYALTDIISSVSSSEGYEVHIFLNDDDFTEKVLDIKNANERYIKCIMSNEK